MARPLEVDLEATTAVPPHGGIARLGGMDGLRAIAAVAVVFHHASIPTAFTLRQLEVPFTGVEWPVGKYFLHLDVGVSIFFLISGFLLYLPFVSAALDQGSPGSTRSYLRRRFLRIFPAYWVAFIFITLFVGLNMPVRGARSFVEYFFLVHSYDWSDGGRRLFGGISQSWTLVVELSFYLFLPLYAFVLRRLGRDRSQHQRLQLEVAGLVALTLVSFVWRAIVFWVIPESSSVHLLGGYWLPANLDLFAMGMALAVTRAWMERQPRPVRTVETIVKIDWLWWVLAFVAFHIVSMNIGLGSTLEFVTGGKAYLRQFLYGLTALFLLLPIVFARTSKTATRRIVDFAPLAYLGIISYGIYLWHQAFIQKIHQWGGWTPKPGENPLAGFRGNFLEHALGALALSVVVATVSWFLVERPILRRKNIPLLRKREKAAVETPGT